MKHVDNALRKTLFILLGLISLFWLFWTFKYLFTDNLRSTKYIFLFVTILLVLLIFFLNKKFKDLLFKTFKFIYGHMYWFIGILFILQVVISLFAQALAQGDSAVLYTVGTNIPDTKQTILKYFSIYPNNFFILIIIKIINSIVTPKYLILSFSILNALLIDSGIILLTSIGKYLKGEKLAQIVFIESFFLIGLQPQFLYFYTDPITFFFTSLLCFLVVKYTYKKYLIWWFVIGLIFSIAYKIRVPVVIYLIALIIVVIYQLVFSPEKIKKRKLVNKTVVLFSGILITIIGINYYAHHQKITEYDTKYSRNFMYFIDLGLTDTGANHSQLPTEILIPEKNGKIQTRTQLESKLNKDIKNRIKNYGILGLIKHQNTKFKYFVQDGTLGWTTEAVLVESNVVKTKFTESTIGHKIRDIIYVHRPYYPKYAIYMQISWIFVVLGLVLYFKKYKKVTYTELVFQLVLLGGILFLSLFEAGRSRYLIQFLPAIILLSSIGYFKMNSSKSS